MLGVVQGEVVFASRSNRLMVNPVSRGTVQSPVAGQLLETNSHRIAYPLCQTSHQRRLSRYYYKGPEVYEDITHVLRGLLREHSFTNL